MAKKQVIYISYYSRMFTKLFRSVVLFLACFFFAVVVVQFIDVTFESNGDSDLGERYLKLIKFQLALGPHPSYTPVTPVTPVLQERFIKMQDDNTTSERMVVPVLEVLPLVNFTTFIIPTPPPPPPPQPQPVIVIITPLPLPTPTIDEPTPTTTYSQSLAVEPLSSYLVQVRGTEKELKVQGEGVISYWNLSVGKGSETSHLNYVFNQIIDLEDKDPLLALLVLILIIVLKCFVPEKQINSTVESKSILIRLFTRFNTPVKNISGEVLNEEHKEYESDSGYSSLRDEEEGSSEFYPTLPVPAFNNIINIDQILSTVTDLSPATLESIGEQEEAEGLLKCQEPKVELADKEIVALIVTPLIVTPATPPPVFDFGHTYIDLTSAFGSSSIVQRPTSKEDDELNWLSFMDFPYVRKPWLGEQKKRVLHQMKEQFRNGCSSTVHGRNRFAIETAIDELYLTYLQKLELDDLTYNRFPSPPPPQYQAKRSASLDSVDSSESASDSEDNSDNSGNDTSFSTEGTSQQDEDDKEEEDQAFFLSSPTLDNNNIFDSIFAAKVINTSTLDTSTEQSSEQAKGFTSVLEVVEELSEENPSISMFNSYLQVKQQAYPEEFKIRNSKGELYYDEDFPEEEEEEKVIEYKETREEANEDRCSIRIRSNTSLDLVLFSGSPLHASTLRRWKMEGRTATATTVALLIRPLVKTPAQLDFEAMVENFSLLL